MFFGGWNTKETHGDNVLLIFFWGGSQFFGFMVFLKGPRCCLMDFLGGPKCLVVELIGRRIVGSLDPK